VIVWSLFDILFAVADMLSALIYERDLNTLPCYETNALHDTMVL
jgi:hypothetical protein